MREERYEAARHRLFGDGLDGRAARVKFEETLLRAELGAEVRE